jgi:hypothetical protein
MNRQRPLAARGERQQTDVVNPTGMSAALHEILGRTCLLKAVAQGKQARIYAVVDEAGEAVRLEDAELLAKVYRSCLSAPDVAREEFHRLERLHGALEGLRINGWAVKVPRPVAVCKTPCALLMTRVPGETVETLMLERRISMEIACAIAEVTASYLSEYWCVMSEIYGDLHLENIVCAPEQGILGFIDPGAPNHPVFSCPDVPARWHPASRDVAYLLFELATANVKRVLTSPTTYVQQSAFAWTVLERVVLNGRPQHEANEFLDEIRACTAVHLGRIDTQGWTKGFWRAWVKVVAARQLTAWLSRASLDRSVWADNPLDADVLQPSALRGRLS